MRLIVAALLALLALPGQAAVVTEPEVKAPAPEIAILSPDDVARYREIFQRQKQGDWRKADRLIAALDDRLLLGHVRHQRLMHPRLYRASFQELSKWLDAYADHPNAEAVYALAMKRRAGHWPKAPAAIPQKGVNAATRPPLPAAEQRFRRDFMHAVSRTEYAKAGEALIAAANRRRIGAEAVARYGGYLAEKWLHQGRDDKALEIAELTTAVSGGAYHRPHWIAGLAAWRLRDCGAAQVHFTAVANADDAPMGERAGGAYWAARAAFKCRRPEEGYPLLARAAEAGTSFYGLIAERQLGLERQRAWQLPSLTFENWRVLQQIDGVRRAVALSQVGDDEKADLELFLAWRRGDDQLYPAYLALAGKLGLAASLYRLAIERPADRERPLGALYPLPVWSPKDGFSLDRALLYALMRQESAFRVRAKSHAGARGLMQVMPKTAGFIARDRRLIRDQDDQLFDPAFNLALGQDYLEYLMDSSVTKGNLFMLLAAYNGGPGNLARWDKKLDFRTDPLLFMETLPLSETRVYVERVMANYWLYRLRLGQPTPSLTSVASGAWPEYEAADGGNAQLARADDRGVPQ